MISESLPKVAEALAEIRSNQTLFAGNHRMEQIRVFPNGLPFTDIDFNPAVHDPHDINPLSAFADVYDWPQVTEVLPEHPLDIHVLIDNEPAGGDERLALAKRWLGRALVQASDNTLSPSDRLHVYIAGDSAQADLDSRTTVLEAGRKEDKLKEVAQDGLSLVVGDFNRFDLAALRPADMEQTVAIKVNHTYDLAIPEKCGVWDLPWGQMVDTHNKKQLAAANVDLAQYHAEKEQALRQAGMTVARVVFNSGHRQMYGLEITAADQQIAAALQEIIRKKA